MDAPAATLRKVRSSMTNAVHDLPLLIAHDECFSGTKGWESKSSAPPGLVNTPLITARCVTMSSRVRWRRPTKKDNALNLGCASGAS